MRNMRNMGRATRQDCQSLLLLLLAPQLIRGFSMVHKEEKQQVLEGSQFEVLCQTDSYYEFCIFVSPIGQRCEFEWRRKNWNISRSDCLELESRTSFLGRYNEFQCGITVANARTSDSGIWGCEMESYKFGGGRGSGFIVRGGVEVLVSEPTTTTTTTTERPTRAPVWPGVVHPTNREGRRLWGLDKMNLTKGSHPISAVPSKTEIAMAALAFSGLLPVLIAGIVIVVFISMFS